MRIQNSYPYFIILSQMLYHISGTTPDLQHAIFYKVHTHFAMSTISSIFVPPVQKKKFDINIIVFLGTNVLRFRIGLQTNATLCKLKVISLLDSGVHTIF